MAQAAYVSHQSPWRDEGIVRQALEHPGELRAELALRRLRHFVRASWPVIEPGATYLENWHIDALCEHLEAVTNNQIKHLLVNVPPRTSKSGVISVNWPVWSWLDDPNAPEDLQLVDCLITNAVRCVPPANKPTTEEIARCRPFLEARLQALATLKTILALGRIAHDSTLAAFGLKRSAHGFAHGAQHALPGGLVLYDSYHCSRLNTNTGRLTTSMFEDLLAEVAASLRRA